MYRLPLIRIELSVNGATLVMEIDTGSSVSLISENTYSNTWTAAKRPPLLPSDTRLYTYSVYSPIHVFGLFAYTRIR